MADEVFAKRNARSGFSRTERIWNVSSSVRSWTFGPVDARIPGAMAVQTTEHITTKAKTGPKGVHVDVSAEELEQAGIHPGEDVLLEVRRYTAEDWFAEGEGRVFTDEEFTAHLERCPPSESDS